MIAVNPGIPAVMFHALVSPGDPFYLGFPVDRFAEVLRLLRKKGYGFVTVADILEGRTGGERSVCLTFDDGFEDNHRLLMPVLEEYGAVCTVLLSTGFVEDRAVPSDPPSAGSKWLRPFLTLGQVGEMHASGLVDFQGHTVTHTWYPTSDRVLSVHGPEEIEENYWVWWNSGPQLPGAPDPLMMRAAFPDGFVLTENRRSLGCRRFIPDKGLAAVPGVGPGDVLPGRYETDGERLERYRKELMGGRERLEGMLGRKVEFLCWPGGVMDELSWKVYLDAGYRSCTMPSSGSKREVARRVMDREAGVLVRMSSSCSCRGVDLGPRELVRRIEQERSGRPFMTAACKLARRAAWLRAVLRSRDPMGDGR